MRSWPRSSSLARMVASPQGSKAKRTAQTQGHKLRQLDTRNEIGCVQLLAPADRSVRKSNAVAQALSGARGSRAVVVFAHVDHVSMVRIRRFRTDDVSDERRRNEASDPVVTCERANGPTAAMTRSRESGINGMNTEPTTWAPRDRGQDVADCAIRSDWGLGHTGAWVDLKSLL